jgi:hypothetical protein
MVTRFAASLRTDNCPQPKEAQPLSQLDIRLLQHFDSSALVVWRWCLTGYLLILNYPQIEVPLRGHLTSCRSNLTPPFFFFTPPARGATTGHRTSCRSY